MLRSSALRWFRVLRAVALATYKEWAAYRSHVLVSLSKCQVEAFAFRRNCFSRSFAID
jgi:hypothetical protein